MSVFGQNRTVKKTNFNLPVLKIESLAQKIARIAVYHKIDPRLFQSLIYTESAFKYNARSPKNAGCLTQLMPDTARRFGLVVNDSVDERFSNLDKCLGAGATYLAWLLSTFKGDVRLALAGYNAGEGAVMKYGNRIPPFRETVRYVEKICALYYGQSGHGVAMAYNQPLAQTWASELYRNRRVSGGGGNSVSRYTPNPGLNDLYLPQNSGDAPITGAKENFVPKKTVVNRVRLKEASPRLRTESLSFF